MTDAARNKRERAREQPRAVGPLAVGVVGPGAACSEAKHRFGHGALFHRPHDNAASIDHLH